MTTTSSVRHLRVVVEAHDYDEAVAFYRDVLGMPEHAAYAEGADDRVAILDAGTASLEIASPAHKQAIDRIEAAGQPSPTIRIAFEVHDTHQTTRYAKAAGASIVAEPVHTPWQSLNSRLEAPAGLQITLFQELETLEQRQGRHGFATDAARSPGSSQ